MADEPFQDAPDPGEREPILPVRLPENYPGQ
jgi:hypothetical protein